MQQPSPAPPGGAHNRGSNGAADGEYEAQENTPLVGAAKQQQQQEQLHGSSFLWQQFKLPPLVMQQRQQDEVRRMMPSVLSCCALTCLQFVLVNAPV